MYFCKLYIPLRHKPPLSFHHELTKRHAMKKILPIAIALLGISAMQDAKAGTTARDTILLDPTRSSAPGCFSNIHDAIADINSRPAGSRVTLLVAPSVYWLDNPDDPAIRVNDERPGDIPYGVSINCDTLSIIGLDKDARNTVFASNRGQTQGAMGNFTMIHFTGKSLELHNMTLGNYCNVDLDYPLDSTLNRRRRGDAIVQAQVGICTGTDRLFASNCRFISRLNLCPMVGSRRSLYKDCHFESTDDALTGSAVYLGCHFTFHSSKPFYNTPPTGAVFLDCDIDLLTPSVQYFTKAPGPVTLVDTRLHTTPRNRDVAVCWTPYNSTSVCYTSNVTLDGKPLTIDPERPSLTIDLDKSRALAAYKVTGKEGETLYNTPSLLGGDDGWDPLGMKQKIIEATGCESSVFLPVALLAEGRVRNLEATNDTVSITAQPVRWGGYASRDNTSENRWSTSTVLNQIAKADRTATFVTRNLLPETVHEVIGVEDGSGLAGLIPVEIAARLSDAPGFRAQPTLSFNQKLKGVQLEYATEKAANGSTDASHVVWYRFRNDNLSDTIPLRHGPAADTALHQVTSADVGYRIAARVTPRHSDSRPGEPVIAVLPSVISKKMVNHPSDVEALDTDFSDVPVHIQPVTARGAWRFDCYKPADTDGFVWEADNSVPAWYYDTGTDGATGKGIVQATRGARSFYTPATTCRDCRDMTVIMQPCKTAGQGFGSATGQYLDIMMAFDPDSLSGYALRIMRTSDYDRAVVFSIVRYENGTVTPMTTPVASSCFRTPCEVRMKIENGVMTATAQTGAAAPERMAPGIVGSVSLSCPVPATLPGNSIGFQHTGTTGAGATLIERVSATW